MDHPRDSPARHVVHCIVFHGEFHGAGTGSRVHQCSGAGNSTFGWWDGNGSAGSNDQSSLGLCRGADKASGRHDSIDLSDDQSSKYSGSYYGYSGSCGIEPEFSNPASKRIRDVSFWAAGGDRVGGGVSHQHV